MKEKDYFYQPASKAGLYWLNKMSRTKGDIDVDKFEIMTDYQKKQIFRYKQRKNSIKLPKNSISTLKI